MKIRKYCLALISLCIFTLSNGQGISQYSIADEDVFKFRVKQLSEFVDIFNNYFDYESRDISAEEAQQLTRQTLLYSLFDMSDGRLIKDSETYSPEYEARAKSFVSNVVDEDLYMTSSSENIYASASATGFYGKKAVHFNIILQQEIVGKDMLKWVVCDIEADFLDFLLKDTINLRFLPPSSDELDFIELRRALNDVDYLDQYANRDYTYDPLSVFFYLLNNNELKIETVPEVNYRILDIPGWDIELTDFNRNSKNSGWLISDLKVQGPRAK
ncbi:MAG: hypothetical protein PF450_16275 [Bacteroidales bacterium]|jgi:hypothetical protein|nr:hypothetical protein [Bacteroidales bacterium]